MDKSLVYESVTIKYESSSGESLVAVDDLSLSLASGSFVAVVGPSGCGKSTLLKATAGLMDCSSGGITVGGAPVDGGDRPPGVVFQNPRLLPWLTVQGNVELGLEGMGVARRTRAERARKELSRVSLTDFAQAFPGQLSGGMQQRVNLARALAIDSGVLLLDEPFSALDALTREQMQGELVRVWETLSPTALFITHQVDEAIFLADEVIVLSARPAKVLHRVRVPFDRPRHLDLKRTREFHDLEDLVWEKLQAALPAGL